jgi:hypothetical protein
MSYWQRWTSELRGAFNPVWLVTAALATLGVLGLTHIPQESIPVSLDFDRYDKFEHIGAYGAMTALYMLALKRQRGGVLSAESSVSSSTQNSGLKTKDSRRWEVRGWLGLAVLGAMGLATIGAVDELTQPYVHRTCDIRDWMSDAVGIAAVTGVFLVRRIITGY